MLPVGAVASRRGRAPEAVRLVHVEPAHVPVVALVGSEPQTRRRRRRRRRGTGPLPRGSVRAHARAPRGGSNAPRAGASSAPFPLARRGRTARDRRAANASAPRRIARAAAGSRESAARASSRRAKNAAPLLRSAARAAISARRASVMPAAPARDRCIWRTLERRGGMPLCICAVAGVARFTGTNGAGASPSRNGCRCSSVGGASDLRRLGTANSMLSPRTGTARLQRGRVAGGHGGCAGTGDGGGSGQRAFGALRWRLESPRWRFAKARNEVGGGIGGEDGRRLAPSPVESDMMLAATCGAAWWAGFTPRGIPIGRVVGCLAQIGVRANSRCLPGRFFGSGAIPTSAASSRNQKPVRGFES